MVSDNLEDLGEQFGQMVDDRDIVGFVSLVGIGSVGGVVVDMVQDAIAGETDMFSADPSSARGLFISFAVKTGIVAALAALSLSMGGPLGLAGMILGVGGAINAGDDLVQSIDRLASNNTNSASTTRTRRRSRSRTSRKRPTRTRRSSRSKSRNIDRAGDTDPYGSLLA